MDVAVIKPGQIVFNDPLSIGDRSRRLAAKTANGHTFYMVRRRSRIVAPDKPTLGQVGSVGVSFVAFLVLLFLCISHGLF
ncbi:hypothetical protein [Rhodococcus sp. MEB064]|uniref:hypothetical protein n=1 Tax=Rhodococcus sp. MEB064 TaxID=1587522 RepID=UPI0005ACEE41|nr:hypothetical protein [Rhodococcus sp. MEB064]KIQ11764.1 hypothetical protein RU01_18330 [Rhodococcus sp. MEB064]